MEFKINSRILKRTITFSRPGGYYIFVDLNGQPGILGEQICRGGKLMGTTICYDGDDEAVFADICKRWYHAFLRNYRELLTEDWEEVVE